MTTIYTTNWTNKDKTETRIYLNELNEKGDRTGNDFGYIVVDMNKNSDVDEYGAEQSECIVSHKIKGVDAELVIAKLVARTIKKQIPLNANATLTI